MLYGWEGNRRSSVKPAMNRGLGGSGEGDGRPTYCTVRTVVHFTFTWSINGFVARAGHERGSVNHCRVMACVARTRISAGSARGSSISITRHLINARSTLT